MSNHIEQSPDTLKCYLNNHDKLTNLDAIIADAEDRWNFRQISWFRP